MNQQTSFGDANCGSQVAQNHGSVADQNHGNITNHFHSGAGKMILNAGQKWTGINDGMHFSRASGVRVIV